METYFGTCLHMFRAFLHIWIIFPTNKQKSEGRIQPRNEEWTKIRKGAQNLTRVDSGWREQCTCQTQGEINETNIGEMKNFESMDIPR